MTVPEAATALEVSPAMVYSLVKAGRIAHRRQGPGRYGGTIVIDPADLEAYRRRVRVEAGTVQQLPAQPSVPAIAPAPGGRRSKFKQRWAEILGERPPKDPAKR